MAIHWHRRDLRVADNPALAAAAAGEDPVVPVFVLDDEVLANASDVRVRFLLDALAALRAAYRELDSDLLVARGDPAEVLPSLAAVHVADRVTWSADYSGLAQDRDARVRRALRTADVDCEIRHAAVHHEPGTITTNEGEPYAVFSYFGRKWRDREKADPVPIPRSGRLADVAGDPLPGIDDLGFAGPEADLPAAGPEAARERLEGFIDGDVFRYGQAREYPAAEATSRLSVDLKWGTIGIRTVSAATGDAMARAEAGDVDVDASDLPVDATEIDPVESVTEFRTQLAWREFYAQVLDANPGVVSENYRSYAHPIEWRDDPAELAAWRAGETGVPIVDAGMRQLLAEGWMHNRVRMIVASFLTKDLLVDWRHGYAHFREHLVDHDTANDTGGWQWASSTGTDAQPYFRIFNPWTQGERYDPDATYIKEYVPELRGHSPATIHEWGELPDETRDQQAPDYPAPIVDHADRREEALATFRRARGKTD